MTAPSKHLPDDGIPQIPLFRRLSQNIGGYIGDEIQMAMRWWVEGGAEFQSLLPAVMPPASESKVNCAHRIFSIFIQSKAIGR
jgi:hypothetical protein